MKLTKAQQAVLQRLKEGAVIGELSDTVNGRYELFVGEKYPFDEIKRLNKNTVFTLLELGLIQEDNSIAENMKPFGRDYWYRYRKAGKPEDGIHGRI